MNSKQGSRYIKTRMGNDLKEKILSHNGIYHTEIKKNLISSNCPRCDFTNIKENKYCSRCSYPLLASAYEEIKLAEETRIKAMEDQIKILEYSQKEILDLLKYPEKLAHIANSD
jgi:integrase/recombinase XerD